MDSWQTWEQESIREMDQFSKGKGVWMIARQRDRWIIEKGDAKREMDEKLEGRVAKQRDGWLNIRMGGQVQKQVANRGMG